MKPLAIDLFCGLGGWTEGLLAEGFRVVGFDTVQHRYGNARYPAQLVIQDVLTLHGSQFKDAALIVASPPCQAYSYRAMPWKKAKALPPPDNTLFEACFRIQREAIEAAGHHIPLVIENVCGAQKWVGRARWHYGSFYLWGDVPALMPITRRAKVGGFSWSDFGKPGYKAVAFNGEAEQRMREGQKVPTDRICDCGHRESEHGFNPDQPCNLCACINPVWVSRRTAIGTSARFTTDCDGTKNDGGSWFGVAHNTTSGHGQNPDGRKNPNGGPGSWFGSYAEQKARGTISPGRLHDSKSSARKAASAHIAKIPLPLARWIAGAWREAPPGHGDR